MLSLNITKQNILEETESSTYLLKHPELNSHCFRNSIAPLPTIIRFRLTEGIALWSLN